MTSPKSIKDLPIYSSPDEAKSVWVSIEQKKQPTALEDAVSSFRQAGCSFLNQFKQQKDDSIKFYESTSQQVAQQLDYISSEYNIIPKVVFISLSGFSGLLLGYRRSAFRKFLYTSVLASGATALCFPKEAKQYSNKAYDAGKQNAYALYRQYVWPEEKIPGSPPAAAKSQPEKLEDQVKKQIDAKDKVLKLDKETIDSAKSTKKLAGDKGQSSDEDKEMYTTRSK